MAYVPKRKNNNNNIRFKRLTSQSNHENKLQKLQQSTMMLQNFNTNATGPNGPNIQQSASSRDSLPIQQQMSVASTQYLQKNSQQIRESHGSDINNRSEPPTTAKLTQSSNQQQTSQAQQYIMSFGQTQQEQTSRISQTSGDSMQNQSTSAGKKFLKNTIQFKNQ